MRPCMGEIEGERGLRIDAGVGIDAGCAATDRAAAVGANDKPCADLVAGSERHGRAVVADVDGDGVILDPLK